MSLENFVIILIFNSFVVPKFILLIAFSLLLKPLFQWMVKNLWPDGYEPFHIFKIKSHILNWFFILLYSAFFVVLLFIFRLYRVGYEFDLKPFILFIKDIIEYKDYIFLCMLITGLLCISFLFIGIMKRIKDFLTRELLKRHLILQAKSSVKQKRKYYKVIIFLDMLKHSFLGIEYYGDYAESSVSIEGIYISLQEVYISLFGRNIMARRLSSFFIFLYNLAKEFDFYTKFFANLANTIIKCWNFVLGIIFVSFCSISIIAYDIIFNNLVLTKIFYFLPFYFVYLLWYQTIGFFSEKNATLSGALCQILYNCYYRKHEVKYLFLTPEHHRIVAYFIRLGLTIDNEISQCDVFSVSRMILWECEYELENKDTKVYTNKHTKKSFIIIEKNGKEEITEIYSGNVTSYNYLNK